MRFVVVPHSLVTCPSYGDQRLALMPKFSNLLASTRHGGGRCYSQRRGAAASSTPTDPCRFRRSRCGGMREMVRGEAMAMFSGSWYGIAYAV